MYRMPGNAQRSTYVLLQVIMLLVLIVFSSAPNSIALATVRNTAAQVGAMSHTCDGESTLEGLIACMVDQMPETGNSLFVAPSLDEQQAWRTVIAQMLDGRCNDITLPGSLAGIYSINSFSDHGQSYCVLRERGDANGDQVVDRGWGTFIVNPTAARELSIQIAHPKDDAGTAAEGIAVFKNTQARTFMMAGTHREAHTQTSSCQRDYNLADVAHNLANMFQPSLEEMLAWYASHQKDVTGLQFHSMQANSCPNVDVYLTHGRPTPPIPPILQTFRDNLRSHNPTWKIVLPGESSCGLHGSTNVQGRRLNGVSAANVCTTPASSADGRFIHIEQDPGEFRNAQKWIAAINETWPSTAPPANLTPIADPADTTRRVICDGRTLDGAKNPPDPPIRLGSADTHVVIRNCIFRNFKDEPIYINGASDVLIEKNQFYTTNSGLPAPDRRADAHAIAIPKNGNNIIIRENIFGNNYADGIQLGDEGREEGAHISEIEIVDNQFSVAGDNIGENAIDIKTVHGRVLVAQNTIEGYRPCEDGQIGCTGDLQGAGIVVHIGAREVTIEKNTIYNNRRGMSIAAGTGGIPVQNITIRNNLVYDNLERGVVINKANSVKLLNNTFVNNASGISMSEAPQIRCANNLLVVSGSRPSPCDTEDNLVRPSIALAKFLDPSTKNFHLHPESPAVNAGVPLVDVGDDIDNERRPGGSAYDVGADEIISDPVTLPELSIVEALQVSPAPGSGGQAMQARFTLRNSGGQDVTIPLLVAGVRDPDGRNVDFPPVANITLQPGQQYIYTQERHYSTTGTYTAWPAAYLNGAWLELAPRSTFTVQQLPEAKLSIISALRIFPSSPTPNQDVQATFIVENTGGRAVTVPILVVGVRNPQAANVDFPPVTNITLQPGQQYTYQQARRFSQIGSYTAWPAAYLNGSWLELAPRSNFAVQSPRGSLLLVEALRLSTSNPSPGTPVEARYTVQNASAQPLTIPWLLAGARDPNNRNVDFPGVANVSLQPGQEYTYQQSRTFTTVGHYSVWPAAFLNNAWVELAPHASFVVGTATDTVLVGAGDIANCAAAEDEATAKLLDTIPGTVITLGDNAYPNGTHADFRDCYAPTWGRHKERTRPAPGNHDYATPRAQPYYDYFGVNAGPAGKGYYSYNIGDWHVVALNSEIDATAGSVQEQWLRSDLAANSSICTLAYFHRPLFSSGSGHGNDDTMQDIWNVLYEYRADVVLSGHDHNYERFAPQDPNGNAAPARGIREFVVGTGGTGLRRIGVVRPNSEIQNANTHGVIKLTLQPTSYIWEFVPIAGTTFRDSGTAPCVR